MAKWVKITGNNTWASGYINLEKVDVLAVIPTLADPSKYVIGVYSRPSSSGYEGFETIDGGPYASIADAEAALEALTQGYTLP